METQVMWGLRDQASRPNCGGFMVTASGRGPQLKGKTASGCDKGTDVSEGAERNPLSACWALLTCPLPPAVS